MDAHRDVSLLEERVAKLLPASNPEGALARRGAVRAAVAAHDFARADALAERYCAETDASTSLQCDLREIVRSGAETVEDDKFDGTRR